eukprot:3931610-Amphidinium_carterae.1
MPPPYHSSYVPWLGNDYADRYAKLGASMSPPVKYGGGCAVTAMHHIRSWTVWVATLEASMLELKQHDTEPFDAPSRPRGQPRAQLADASATPLDSQCAHGTASTQRARARRK